ncbi:mechanosensitive ion channel protein MscL [Paenibacillus sp. NPDC058071]|uniref:mechanosensitive ion channel protein MscL n=1 Tax=Paenibacillus sp. NPDC058071 TaxID=3346326 RepID=UPI0036DBEC9C
MIVFDVIVDGEVKETIKPSNLRLKEIYAFMQKEALRLQERYAGSFSIHRRLEY